MTRTARRTLRGPRGDPGGPPGGDTAAVAPTPRASPPSDPPAVRASYGLGSYALDEVGGAEKIPPPPPNKPPAIPVDPVRPSADDEIPDLAPTPERRADSAPGYPGAPVPYGRRPASRPRPGRGAPEALKTAAAAAERAAAEPAADAAAAAQRVPAAAGGAAPEGA